MERINEWMEGEKATFVTNQTSMQPYHYLFPLLLESLSSGAPNVLVKNKYLFDCTTLIQPGNLGFRKMLVATRFKRCIATVLNTNIIPTMDEPKRVMRQTRALNESSYHKARTAPEKLAQEAQILEAWKKALRTTTVMLPTKWMRRTLKLRMKSLRSRANEGKRGQMREEPNLKVVTCSVLQTLIAEKVKTSTAVGNASC